MTRRRMTESYNCLCNRPPSFGGPRLQPRRNTGRERPALATEVALSAQANPSRRSSPSAAHYSTFLPAVLVFSSLPTEYQVLSTDHRCFVHTTLFRRAFTLAVTLMNPRRSLAMWNWVKIPASG